VLIKLVNGACTIGDKCARVYCDSPGCNASLGPEYQADIRIIDIYGNVVKEETVNCSNTPYDIVADVKEEGLYFIRNDIVPVVSLLSKEETLPGILKTEQILVPIVKSSKTINPSNYKQLRNAIDAWMTIFDTFTNLVWNERVSLSKAISIPSSRLIGLVSIENKDRTGCLIDQNGDIYCGHAAIVTIRYKFSSIYDLKTFLFMKAAQMYPDFEDFYFEFCNADINKMKALAFYLRMPLCMAGTPVLSIRVDTQNLVIEQDIFIRLGDIMSFIGHALADIAFGCAAGAGIAALGGPISSSLGCAIGALVGLGATAVFYWKDVSKATNESAKIIYENGMRNLNSEYNQFKEDIENLVQSESVKAQLLKDLNTMYTHCSNTLSTMYEAIQKQIDEAKIKYGVIGFGVGFVIDRLLSR